MLLNNLNKDNDFVYVIVGNNTQRLNYLIQKLSLDKKIYTLSNKDRNTIIKCYQSAWCFFSPSIIEGLSLVSIEAMATGLPLVVTNVPGNEDIVRDNQCGLIVKNKDPHSMANGILSLSSDQSLYKKCQKMAIENRHLYDWKNIAKKYLDVYKKVINTYNSKRN